MLLSATEILPKTEVRGEGFEQRKSLLYKAFYKGVVYKYLVSL